MVGDYDGCVGCDSALKDVIKIITKTPAARPNNSRQSPPRDNRPKPRKRNSDHFNDNGNERSNEEAVQCECGMQAGGPFTVRKEGPNQGREFFGCGNNRSCKFFQWADEQATQNQRNSSRAPPQKLSTQRTNLSTHDDNVQCHCNQDGLKLTVRKEGPNQGREFFKCGNNPQGCNFFQWADEPNAQSNQSLGGSSTRGGRSSNRGRGTSRRGGSTGGGTRKPPTCSTCGQIGHTKRGCKNS